MEIHGVAHLMLTVHSIARSRPFDVALVNYVPGKGLLEEGAQRGG
jgi:hypothetical protein